MNKLNISALIISILVIGFLFGAAVAIAYRNVWLIVLCLVLSFGIMGYGISLKKRRSQ